MKPDLGKLRALAEAATPGPWNDCGENGVTQTKHITRDVWTIPRTVDDVAFIAAANPETVLALLDELAQHEAINGHLDTCRDCYAKLSHLDYNGQCCSVCDTVRTECMQRDIPILEECDQLRAELEDIRSVCKPYLDGVFIDVVNNKKLEIERDQLRERVKELEEKLGQALRSPGYTANLRAEAWKRAAEALDKAHYWPTHDGNPDEGYMTAAELSAKGTLEAARALEGNSES